MADLRNIKIEGMGSCYGGVYDNVKLEGVTSIKDDLKCSVFSSEGMCKCDGAIECEQMKVSGTFKSNMQIKAKSLIADGIFTSKGSISADSIKLQGVIKCDELSADDIYIEGACKADKIFGEKIIINSSTNIIGFNLFFKKSDLSKAELIECTEIKANMIDAQIIRASRVKLGKHCKIDIVEYSEYADIHPNAKIGKLVKI